MLPLEKSAPGFPIVPVPLGSGGWSLLRVFLSAPPVRFWLVRARSRWGPGQGFSLPPFCSRRGRGSSGKGCARGETAVPDAQVEWRGGCFGEEGHGGGKRGRESGPGRAELGPPEATEGRSPWHRPLGTEKGTAPSASGCRLPHLWGSCPASCWTRPGSFSGRNAIPHWVVVSPGTSRRFLSDPPPTFLFGSTQFPTSL